MVSVRGKSGVDQFFARTPADVQKLLRAAGKVGAKVVADEARDRVIAQEVRQAIVTRTKADDGRITVKISVKPGWERSVGTWLEYGTSPHFISVDESQRAGRGIGRINKQQAAGEIVINGQFVGSTVFHPGARPHPFLRPALDHREADAVKAMQAYINSRVTPKGIVGADGGGDE